MIKDDARKDIREHIRELKERYKNMTRRQRAFAYLYGSLAIFVIGNLFGINTLYDAVVKMQSQIEQASTSLDAITSQTDLILAEVEGSVANPQSARSRELRENISKVDEKLKEYYSNLIPASQMSSILQEVLTSDTRLTLESIKTLPSVRILTYQSGAMSVFNEGSEKAAAGQTPEKTLYRKGMDLIFRGGYFDTLDYLKRLESLEYRLFWDDLKYTVTEYPEATVTISVYTLSEEEGWIGG